MMNDTEIGNAIKRLPRTNASPRFTSDVLRRAREGRQGASFREALHAGTPAFRLAAAFALMFCVAGLTYETAVIHQRHQRLDALRAEHQRIESELQQVKALADDPQPVVVLENGDTRVIVPAANRSTGHYTPQPIMY
jgi:hypothetical protein